MEFSLSELPFFPLLVLPEEPTLSQLPFFAQDSVENSFLPPRPSSVCEACWEGPFAIRLGLPLVSPRNGQWYRRWPEEISYSISLAELEFRADAGCVWCQLVLRMLRWTHRYRHSEERLIVTVCGHIERRDDGSEKLKPRYQWISVNINGESVCDDAYVYTALDDPAEPYVIMQNPVLNLEAPRFLSLTRQHIDQCVDVHRHERCHSSVSPISPQRLLPKRLVDCTDLARPRLFSPPEEHAEYLALSYVWGEDQVHKTTTSNLSTYEHGIASSLLPATIRDAIRLTHRLRFRALWVDSLCIVQDSDEDKLHEIGRMHHIYRYAHLTIVAASADSASQGFLYKQPPKDVALPFICPPGPTYPQVKHGDSYSEAAQSQVGEVYLSSESPLDRVGRGSYYYDVIGRMAKRSWCLQEYLMSPRSLIFTPIGVFFRCRATMQSVRHSLDVIRPDPRLPDALFLAIPPAVTPRSKEWMDIHRAWTDIIQNYSGRTASDELDKLVACAAIAESFHGVLRSDYLAGSWRTDALLVDLLWTSARPEACTVPTVYRAPSWSWAAVEGSIKHPLWIEDIDFQDTRTMALAEVAECWVTLKDPALPFGRVMDGTLILHGTPIPCRGRSAQKYCLPGKWSVPLPSFEEARRQQWGLGDLHSADEEALRVDWIKQTRDNTVARVTMDCNVDALPGRMWVVPFMRTRWPFDHETDLLHGIVFELVPPSNDSDSESKNMRFRRIGSFMDMFVAAKDEEDLGNPLWEPLTRAIKSGEHPWTDIAVV